MRNESILKDWPEKVSTTYLFLKALLKVVSSNKEKIRERDARVMQRHCRSFKEPFGGWSMIANPLLSLTCPTPHSPQTRDQCSHIG